MYQTIVVLLIAGLLLSGTVYIMLGCENSSVSNCETNLTVIKEISQPYLSPWERFLQSWRFEI